MIAFVCDWCGAITPKSITFRFYEFYDDGDWPLVHIGRHRKKLHMCDYCYNRFKKIIVGESQRKQRKNKEEDYD